MSTNDNQNKKDLNVILNDKERALLLDHNYDGIEEFDYPLPSWWVWTFIGGVAFAAMYIFYYQFAGGASLKDEFNQDMAKVMQLREEEAKNVNKFDLDTYNAWVASNDGVNKGKAVFEENCISCHLENARGDIGPNLTDSYWINVKKVDPTTIYPVVVTGVEDNGMPAWGEVLSKEELYAAVAYVLSLKNTNVADGKAPQGEKVEE